MTPSPAFMHTLFRAPWYTHLYRALRSLIGDPCFAPEPKTYNSAHAHWHTHLYRAGVCLFVPSEKPWHTHLYRAILSALKHPRYTVIPLASVIVPVYNTESWLGQCLDSLLAQTLQNIEIICINDGSTDSSAKILRAYSKKDKRIRIIDQKNRGQGAARNAGIAAAHGEFLAFVDSDDWLAPTALDELYKKATSCNADVVLMRFALFKNGEFLPADWTLQTNLLPSHSDVFSVQETPHSIFQIQAPTVCGKLFDHAFWKANIPPFQSIKFEDILPSTLSMACAKKITYIDKPFYNYRQNVTDSTTANNLLHAADHFPAYRETKKLLEERGIFTSVEKSFWTTCLSSLIWIVESFASYSTTEKEKFLQLCKEFLPEDYFAELQLRSTTNPAATTPAPPEIKTTTYMDTPPMEEQPAFFNTILQQQPTPA